MINIEKSEKNKNIINVKVTVDNEKVQQEYKNTYHELSQKVKIPGFRSGRVPVNILEMNLGKEYIDHQVADKLIKDSYTEAIDKSELDPIDVPKIDLIEIDKEKPFVYNIVLEVKPDFEIPELDDISVDKTKPSVSEKEINEDLERIKQSHGKLNIVTDRESKLGDFLIVDYEAFIENKPAPDGKKEKQMFQLGERSPKEFNDNLVGMKPGDEKEVKMKIPEDISDKTIAGKEIIYKIKLSDIKERELPALDDDFAKSVGDYNTLDDLKKHIKNQIYERKKYDIENEFSENLLEKVAEKVNLEVPKVLIEKQVESMMNNLTEDLKNRNITLEAYYKMIKADESKVKKEYSVIAETQIKKELIIDKIIQSDKITSTDEEVNKKIDEIAKSTNQKPLKVRAMFEKNNTLDNLKQEIKREKVIEKLSRQVKVNEK